MFSIHISKPLLHHNREIYDTRRGDSSHKPRANKKQCDRFVFAINPKLIRTQECKVFMCISSVNQNLVKGEHGI